MKGLFSRAIMLSQILSTCLWEEGQSGLHLMGELGHTMTSFTKGLCLVHDQWRISGVCELYPFSVHHRAGVGILCSGGHKYKTQTSVTLISDDSMRNKTRTYNGHSKGVPPSTSRVPGFQIRQLQSDSLVDIIPGLMSVLKPLSFCSTPKTREFGNKRKLTQRVSRDLT